MLFCPADYAPFYNVPTHVTCISYSVCGESFACACVRRRTDPTSNGSTEPLQPCIAGVWLYDRCLDTRRYIRTYVDSFSFLHPSGWEIPESLARRLGFLHHQHFPFSNHDSGYDVVRVPTQLDFCTYKNRTLADSASGFSC